MIITNQVILKSLVFADHNKCSFKGKYWRTFWRRAIQIYIKRSSSYFFVCICCFTSRLLLLQRQTLLYGMEEKFGWFPAFISKVKLAATQCSQFWWGAPRLTGTSSTQYRILESHLPFQPEPNYFWALTPPEAQFWRFGFAWILIRNYLWLLFGPSVNHAKDWLDHSFLFPGPA